MTGAVLLLALLGSLLQLFIISPSSNYGDPKKKGQQQQHKQPSQTGNTPSGNRNINSDEHNSDNSDNEELRSEIDSEYSGALKTPMPKKANKFAQGNRRAPIAKHAPNKEADKAVLKKDMDYEEMDRSNATPTTLTSSHGARDEAEVSPYVLDSRNHRSGLLSDNESIPLLNFDADDS